MLRNLLIVLSVGMLAACTQDKNESVQDDSIIAIGKRFSIASETLGEDREYLVYLPESYDSGSSSQRYPVMYLLDGGAHFPSASGVVQFMSTGINGNLQIPELIVVAIPNTNRTRDLTPTHTMKSYDGEEEEFLKDSGGGDAFLAFVRDELIPEIESTYRTMPHRTLVGHSFGGLLALHAVTTAPELFQSYIAIDPSLWWHDGLLVSQAAEIFANDSTRQASVYISLADHPGLEEGEPDIMEEAGREFSRILENAVSPGIRSRLQHFKAEDHGSVPLLSLYHGLLSTFDGYKLPIDEVLEKPESIIEHYEKVTEQLGIELLPPESFVNNLGNYLLYDLEETDKAIGLFEINVANYPDSANAYDRLGEAFKISGDKELAIQNYEHSLTLDPKNDNARNELEALRAPEESP